MELVVEPEHMRRDVEPDLVGGPPRDDGGRASHDHLHHLGCDHDREEHEREVAQLGDARPVRRAIDDATHDERPREQQ